jgi:hypothetical protein
MRMNAMKRLLSVVALAACSLGLVPLALAHGDGTPKHGGVVQSANDLSFELVGLDSAAMLYLEDHGEPLDTAGFGGKLSVLLNGVKTDAALKPAGANKLAASGLKLAPGAKAVAVVTTPQNQTISVRFTLR